MCTSKPKAPPPSEKQKPLRILLSRALYDKMPAGNPTGMAAAYGLPPRSNAASSSGLNVGGAGLNVLR